MRMEAYLFGLRGQGEDGFFQSGGAGRHEAGLQHMG